MKEIDYYIGKSTTLNALLVLVVLIGLFTFFSFIDEIDDIGQGDYDAFKALQYVLLQSPRRLYELFPIAALLGVLLSLGMMANHSELTVMRASGISINRIYWSTMKAIGFMMVIVIILGEWVAPYSERQAQHLRSIAKAERIALQTRYGFWARDGNMFINIRDIQGGGRLGNISLFEFEKNGKMHTITHSQHANYQQKDKTWILEDSQQNRFFKDRIVTNHIEQAQIGSLLNPELIGILILKPERLSVWDLYQYIDYLKENSQRSAQYELAFWGKVVYPVLVAVMTFLAIPFVFGSLRTVPVGQRIMIGALLGIGFHIFNQTIGHIGLIYNMSPLGSAVIPSVLFLMIGVFLMRRVT